MASSTVRNSVEKSAQLIRRKPSSLPSGM
jgi:hypothetical protein